MKLIGSCPSCSEKVQSGSTQQLDDVKWVFTPRWLISPQASVFKNTCLFGFDLFTSALCEDEASDAWWLLMGTFLLSVEESFYKHHPFEVWGPSTGILLRRDFTSATVGLFGSRCWFTCLSWMAEIKKKDSVVGVLEEIFRGLFMLVYRLLIIKLNGFLGALLRFISAFHYSHNNLLTTARVKGVQESFTRLRISKHLSVFLSCFLIFHSHTHTSYWKWLAAQTTSQSREMNASLSMFISLKKCIMGKQMHRESRCCPVPLMLRSHRALPIKSPRK